MKQKKIDLLPGILFSSDLAIGVGFILGVLTVGDILELSYRFVHFLTGAFKHKAGVRILQSVIIWI